MTPEALTSMLDVVELHTIEAGVRILRSGAKTVPPAAFGVAEDKAGQPVLALMPLLDLAQRFSALRQAVTKANAKGFVFMFDGVVKGLTSTQDALLVVTCTTTTRRAKAILYRRTVDGIVVGNTVDAPDGIAAEYQKVLDVHPQPPAPGH